MRWEGEEREEKGRELMGWEGKERKGKGTEGMR